MSKGAPENLGLVQLVQRLGSSIERRRAWIAERGAAPAPALRSVPDEFEAAPPEEAAQAMANYFGRADSAPGPLAPEPRDTAEMAAEALPDDRRPHLLRSPVAVDEEAEEDPAAAQEDEPGDDQGDYSSLLAIGNPFAARESEFVRIDEPEDGPDSAMPAVAFPGHQASFAPSFAAAPAQAAESPAAAQRRFDPPGQGPALPAAMPTADTDAALRAALATLQRISGAA